jgi:hypothetical protein
VRRIALLAATAGVVVLTATGTASAAAPIEVKTSISPDWIYFADGVTARVDVVVDRTLVDATSVQVAAPFTPWEETGEQQVTTAQTGGVTHLTIAYTLRCIVFDCLPKGTVVQRFRLPVVTVTALSVDGGSIVVKRPWPPVNVAGRFLPPVIGAVRPQLLLETRAPTARFGVSPSTSALAFDAGAGLVGLVALVLVALEVRRYVERRRNPVDERPPLVRALDLVREAQMRDREDRRRAVALLARLLEDGNQTAAAEIAWSKSDPSPDELEQLAGEIEASLGRR